MRKLLLAMIQLFTTGEFDPPETVKWSTDAEDR